MMKRYTGALAILTAAALAVSGCAFFKPAGNATAWEKIPDAAASSQETAQAFSQGAENASSGLAAAQENVQEKPDTAAPLQETAAEQTAAQETAQSTPDDFYRLATSLSAKEVEEYAGALKELMFTGDITALLGYVAFPLTIDDVTYRNFFSLMGLDYGSGIQQSFIDALSAEDCREMTCTANGILMGEGGQIRLQEVNGELKVVELSGLLK